MKNGCDDICGILFSLGVPSNGCDDICDKLVRISAYKECVSQPRCQVQNILIIIYLIKINWV